MLWDATNGAHVRTLEGHSEGVNDIAWSSDPVYLATGSDDYSVKIWNVQRVRASYLCPIGCPLTPPSTGDLCQDPHRPRKLRLLRQFQPQWKFTGQREL